MFRLTNYRFFFQNSCYSFELYERKNSVVFWNNGADKFYDGYTVI